MEIKRDFRKLSPATQAELRRVAVAMVRAGKTRVEAAKTVGVNRRFVGQWVKVAAQGGEAVLAGGRRGRRPGEQKALSAAQEDRLRVLIARGCPDQFGLSFALWTRQAVRALIARETGVWLTLSVVGRYLRAWGFTTQRPARRATERREGVRAWLERTYPAIARNAKAQGCEIQWADETGLSSRANYGRSFAPRGHTPVIRRPGKRFSQSMISSLTNQGKLRFMIYEGALKAPIFLNFLQRLIREATRKLFVIVDNLPVHRAHRVTTWVQDHADLLPAVLCPRAQSGRIPQQRSQAGDGAPSHATGQGCAQVQPDLLHAQPATLSRQSACLLPGSFRPLCRVKSQCYIFAARISKTQNGRFKMISRLLATLGMLLLAFVAFSDNALNAGYFTTVTGFLFLLLAVVIWFKWGTIGRIFYAVEGNDPIIETASKVVSRIGFPRHDRSSHHLPSSNR